MKKFLTITLLVLLTVGLFVSCDGNAVETVFKNKTNEDSGPFKFVAQEDNVTVKINKSDATDAPEISLVYRQTNGTGWTEWTDYTWVSEEGCEIQLNNAEEVEIKAKTTNESFGKSGYKYNYFVLTGKVAARGNIMFLLDSTGKSTEVPEYCFLSLFQGCNTLTEAPALPATTLGEYCYENMFAQCSALTKAPELPALTLANDCYHQMFAMTSLTEAPALPATTLANECYWNMFLDCSSLTTAPELPATTLAVKCYADMFSGCSSLKTAPALPATTLDVSCYAEMFSGCTALETAPARLPAETLAEECYSKMFSGCSSLETAPALPATTLDVSCYAEMFSGCSSLKTAPALPATTLDDNCYGGMFENCTFTTAPELPATNLANNCYHQMFKDSLLETAPELPATNLANNCYEGMFQGCTKLTAVPARLPALTLAESCYISMFDGCSSLTTAPELPAKTLVKACYSNLFQDCSNLGNIKMLATNGLSAERCLENWVARVASTGTFVRDASTSLPSGNNGIPSGWTVKKATWGVTGKIENLQFNWDKDVEMTETTTKVFKTSNYIQLNTSDQFKVRFGGAWDINYGAPGSQEPYVISSGTPITATTDGKNIAVPENALYSITLNLNNNTITVELAPAG